MFKIKKNKLIIIKKMNHSFQGKNSMALTNMSIQGAVNSKINNEQTKTSSKIENTNECLINQQQGSLENLNKKSKNKYKRTHSSSKSTRNKYSFNILSKNFNPENFDDINIEKWYQNKIKIFTKDGNKKKIFYNFLSEENNIQLLSQKTNGLYFITNIKDDNKIVAKISWNIFSNHFKVYDEKNVLIEEVIYNLNFKGWNGPTKLQIILPKTDTRRGSWKNIRNNQMIHKMQNKLPVFDDFYKCYVLYFIRRNIIPNEKNIQIIYSEFKEDGNNILLQFAQTKEKEYIIDYKYPFNDITAFAFGITLMASRTFCQ